MIPLDQAVELYFNQQLSLKVVADKLNTYPNNVRRILLKAGYTLRDKAASQIIAMESGRAEHPTKGKKLSKKTKLAISKGLETAWENRPAAQKIALANDAKTRWHEREPSVQAEFAKKAALGVRNAGIYGSKIEQFLLAKLREQGFNPQYQRENLIFSERMRVDIFLPDDSIALEIDGPTHYVPIWGEEALVEKMAKDDKKNGLLLYCGYHVLRVRCRRKTLTKNYKELVWSKVYWEVERLAKIKKPELIIMEIRDERN